MRQRPDYRPSSALVVCAGFLAACATEQRAPDTAAVGATAGATAAAAAGPRKVAETSGFEVPESVKYDAERDVYYVSNINGNPSRKDNNGWIAVVRADSVSVVTRLVEGGRNGITLHAPKGMALRGDTLFVADIDALRMFHKRTGASLGTVTLTAQRATFLNDVAVGPDGIYVTDTGIRFDAQGNVTHPGVDRVFRIAGRVVTEVLKGDALGRPNGIAWDSAGKRFIIVPFGAPTILAWSPGDSQPTVMLAGPGGFDGVEVLANGNILVSSWNDSTVHVIHGGAHIMPGIRNVSAPADIGIDTKRNLVAVPRFNDGKVEYYTMPY